MNLNFTQVGEVGNDRLYVTALKGANINEAAWREATEEEKMTFEEAMRAEQEKVRPTRRTPKTE